MKDRKNQYSIGEVAALLNISPQTLRFYDKSGVVVPDFIDQKTGYRYYSYDQISYISRVRYLQQFGFSLEEIRNALASNDIRQFRSFLQRRREDLRAKAEHLTGLLEDLDWWKATTSTAFPTISRNRSGISWPSPSIRTKIFMEPQENA